jgi:outer membrane biosynthesis protein TonB
VALLVLFVVAMAWVWRFPNASDPEPAEPATGAPANDFGTITTAEPLSIPLEPVEEPEPPEPEVAPTPSRNEPPKVVKKAAPPPVVTPEPEPVVPPVEEAPPVVRMSVVDTVEVATVGVFVKNGFKESVLTLLVDGSEVFTADMTTEAKGLSRVYKKALRKAHKDVSTELEIPVGPHRISAHVLNVAKQREYEQSVEVELTADDERSLHIVAGKTFGSRLKLTFE